MLFCLDAPCSELQGVLSGLLPDSQISASSMRDIHGNMGAARLVASRSGWFPNPTQPVAGEEWLQVPRCFCLICREEISQPRLQTSLFCATLGSRRSVSCS